jgi:hypothetical protein
MAAISPLSEAEKTFGRQRSGHQLHHATPGMQTAARQVLAITRTELPEGVVDSIHRDRHGQQAIHIYFCEIQQGVTPRSSYE